MCRGDGGSEAAKSSCRVRRGAGGFRISGPVVAPSVSAGTKFAKRWIAATSRWSGISQGPGRPCGRGRLSPLFGQRVEFKPRLVMTQTTNRLFDEMARLMNDAAGVASGVRREFETVFRNQADRILRDLDVVKREEFEAVKEMARLAREETEALKARVAALEAKLGSGGNR